MYNFELESFQHFIPFCLFLKCWWRNCSISCIPLTAAETFLRSVTCFSLLNVLQHKVKLNFQSALMNVWKCHGSDLSGPQRGLGAFWHLLWAFYCPEFEHTDVQFVSPILPNSRIIPPPSHRHHRSIRPSLSSIPPPHPRHMKTSIYTTGYCTLPLSRRTALIHHTLRCTPTTPIHLSIS